MSRRRQHRAWEVITASALFLLCCSFSFHTPITSLLRRPAQCSPWCFSSGQSVLRIRSCLYRKRAMSIFRNHLISLLDSSARRLPTFNKPAMPVPFYACKGRHARTFLC